MADFYRVAQKATDIFCTFSDEKPDLVDIGIPAFAERVGGLFQGNTMVIGAAQNVGKTSFVQRMLLESKDKGGVVSCEDGEDVWGCRILAQEARLSPTKIRRDDLTHDERERLREAVEALERRSLEGTLPEVMVRIGANWDDLEKAAELMAERGCRYAILDYLQKVRGMASERRHEVAGTLNRWHKFCTKNGMVPIALSQVVRMPKTKEPYPWHLKESGDLENEARIIIMLWRDGEDELTMRCKVAKSSLGGGGHQFAYRFDDNEQLSPYKDDPFEEY